MNRVVIDASAGVDLLLATPEGSRLSQAIPGDSDVLVPEVYLLEVAATLCRMELSGLVSEDRAAFALRRLLTLKATRVQIKPLLTEEVPRRCRGCRAGGPRLSLTERDRSDLRQGRALPTKRSSRGSDAKLRLAPSQALPSSSTCPPTTTTRPTQPGPAPSHAAEAFAAAQRPTPSSQLIADGHYRVRHHRIDASG